MSASCPSCDFESLARGLDRGNRRRARLCLWTELLCAWVLWAAVLGRGLGRVRHGVSARCASAVASTLSACDRYGRGSREEVGRPRLGACLVSLCTTRACDGAWPWVATGAASCPPAGLVLVWCSACDIRDHSWCGVVRLRRVRRRQQHNRPTVPGPWLHGRALKAR